MTYTLTPGASIYPTLAGYPQGNEIDAFNARPANAVASYAVDLTTELPVGDSFAGALVISILPQDAGSPSIGSVALTGNTVSFLAKGGLPEQDYHLNISGRTATNQVIQYEAIMPISPAPFIPSPAQLTLSYTTETDGNGNIITDDNGDPLSFGTLSPDQGFAFVVTINTQPELESFNNFLEGFI
jgi:hypothetical protein